MKRHHDQCRGHDYGDSRGHNYTDSRGHKFCADSRRYGDMRGQNYGDSNSACSNSRGHYRNTNRHSYMNSREDSYNGCSSAKYSRGHNDDYSRGHGYDYYSRGCSNDDIRGQNFGSSRGHNYSDSTSAGDGRGNNCDDSRGHYYVDSNTVKKTERSSYVGGSSEHNHSHSWGQNCAGSNSVMGGRGHNRYDSKGRNYNDSRGNDNDDSRGHNYDQDHSRGHNYNDSRGHDYDRSRGHDYDRSRGHDSDHSFHFNREYNNSGNWGDHNGDSGYSEDKRGHNHDDSRGRSHDDSRGRSYDDSRGHNHDDSRGRSHDDSRGHNHDDSRGRSHDGSRGRSYDDSRGRSYDDSRGRSHDDSRGRSHDDSRGRNHDDSRGRSYDDSRGHNHDDSRGRSHDDGHDDSRGRSHDDSRGRSYDDSRGHNHDDSRGRSHDDRRGRSHDDSRGHNYDDSKGHNLDDSRGHNHDSSREHNHDGSRGHSHDSRRGHNHDGGSSAKDMREQRRTEGCGSLDPNSAFLSLPTLPESSVSHSTCSLGGLGDVSANRGVHQDFTKSEDFNLRDLNCQFRQGLVADSSRQVSLMPESCETFTPNFGNTDPRNSVRDTNPEDNSLNDIKPGNAVRGTNPDRTSRAISKSGNSVRECNLENSPNDQPVIPENSQSYTKPGNSVSDTTLWNPANSDTPQYIDLTTCDDETELVAVMTKISSLLRGRRKKNLSEKQQKQYKFFCQQKTALKKRIRQKKRNERQKQSLIQNESCLLLKTDESQGKRSGSGQPMCAKLLSQKRNSGGNQTSYLKFLRQGKKSGGCQATCTEHGSLMLREEKLKVTAKLDEIRDQIDVLLHENVKTKARKKAYKKIQREKNNLQSRLGQICKALGNLCDETVGSTHVDPFCELSKLAQVVAAWRQRKQLQLTPGTYLQEESGEGEEVIICEEKQCLWPLQTESMTQEEENQSVESGAVNTPQVKQEGEITEVSDSPPNKQEEEVKVADTSHEDVIVISDSDTEESTKQSHTCLAEKHQAARTSGQLRKLQNRWDRNLLKLSRDVDQCIKDSKLVAEVDQSYFLLAGLASVLLSQQRCHSNQQGQSQLDNPAERSVSYSTGQQTGERQGTHTRSQEGDEMSHPRISICYSKPSPCRMLIAKIARKLKLASHPNKDVNKRCQSKLPFAMWDQQQAATAKC